jgi:hypothetical protein
MNFLTIKTFIFMYAKTRRMNLQTEKLQLIEWLARLQDTDIVRRLLEVKQDSEAAAYEASLKPMTVEELLARAEESNQAIEAGDHVDIEDALAELED